MAKNHYSSQNQNNIKHVIPEMALVMDMRGYVTRGNLGYQMISDEKG
jgi:hypothetical protein